MFYDGTEWKLHTSETSLLPNNYVHDIEIDPHGRIWVATDGGILHISHNGWRVYNSENSALPTDAIRSVTTDSHGNLWVGTWGGGIVSRINNQWTVYNTANSNIASNGIFTIEVDDFDTVWAGTYNGGVSYLNGQTWANYNASNSELPNNHVRSIIFDHSGIVWFGTEEGLVRKTPGGHWDVYTFSNVGFSFHAVYDGVQTAPGKLFFATDGGILEFDQLSFNYITSQNSNLSSDNLRSIALNPDGDLWVGTGNAGLSFYSTDGTLDVLEPRKGDGIITLFPNPVSNELTFLLPNKTSGTMEIIVTDVIGQAVIRKSVEHGNGKQHHLNVSDLAPGTYNLVVQTASGLSTKKFLRI